jgi:anti-anti-sigma factor
MSALSSTYVESPHSTVQLRCATVPDRDTVTVLALGELDLLTVPVLDATLRDQRAAGFQRLRLDLRRLEFIDLRGLALLLRWRELATLEGFEVDIEPGSGVVARLIALSRTGPDIGRHGDRPAAARP